MSFSQIEIKLGVNINEIDEESDVIKIQSITNFKKEIEVQSDGRLKVELFGTNQLGSQHKQAQKVQSGDIQMTIQATSVLSPYTEHIEILDLPFLWPSETKMINMLQDGIEDELLLTLSDAGFKGLSIWPYSLKHFTNNERPIYGPEDLQGLDMRTQDSSLLIKQFELWGANPKPLHFGKIYESIQTGIVDGQDNGLETIYTDNFYEVQKYLTLSGHNTMNYVFFANIEWFNNLPKDLQEMIESAAKHSAQVYFDLRMEKEDGILEKIKGAGVEVNELSEGARQKFIELSQPLYEQFVKTDIQRRIYKKIQNHR